MHALRTLAKYITGPRLQINKREISVDQNITKLLFLPAEVMEVLCLVLLELDVPVLINI